MRVGDDVLVGPHAHVNGATIEAGCFVATGVSVFPGARLGRGCDVRTMRWCTSTRCFPGTVYGLPRGTPAAELMAAQSAWYGAHRDDTVV